MRLLRLALIYLALCAPAYAQGGMMPGPGMPASAGGGGYTGLLDVISGAKFVLSVRCASTSYTGSVMDVFDAATGSTTETLITCSSGGTLNTGSPTALATTCASGCRVKTWFDQSGNTNCSGATPCNFTNATNANRPALLNFATPTSWQVSFVAANSTRLVASSFGGVTAPFPITLVAERPNATSGGQFFNASPVSMQGRSGVANGWDINNGAVFVDFVISDNTMHSLQFNESNGASSAYVIDGAATTINMGSSSLGGANSIIGDDGVGSHFLDGLMTEYAIYPTGTWTPTQYGNICHNQRIYFGTPGSC